jgi:4'-phosphopantetheinyl transferase EntD
MMTFCIGHYQLGLEAAASADGRHLSDYQSILPCQEAHRLAMNPARLSATLGGLFPPGAVAAELLGAGDPELLLPAEAVFIGRAVPKRVQEFAAGRLCARRALAEFGIVDFPIKVADDRQPIWPDTMVGSITHTAGFCAAVVAERRHARALGLDSEVVGDVTERIWHSICVPLETAWVRSLPASEQAAAVTLIFSAKEAFYKCQYAIVRERLGFHDARVQAVGWGAADGVFNIHATRDIAMSTRTALPIRGRYLFHEAFVTAGIALGPAAVAAAVGGTAGPGGIPAAADQPQ